MKKLNEIEHRVQFRGNSCLTACFAMLFDESESDIIDELYKVDGFKLPVSDKYALPFLVGRNVLPVDVGNILGVFYKPDVVHLLSVAGDECGHAVLAGFDSERNLFRVFDPDLEEFFLVDFLESEYEIYKAWALFDCKAGVLNF